MTAPSRDPQLPEGVAPEQLDPAVRRDLRSLPKPIADRVAAHLVAAGMLLDEEAERAYAHAATARRLAARVAATREALGIAAYHVGKYAEALAELRAVRRMTGSVDHLPVLADCERGLGRPERALILARDPDVRRLDRQGVIELRIVESGARRDLGEAEAAVAVLRALPELDADVLGPWTARLWYAYADALLAAGRRDDALTWFHSVVAVDDDEVTDARERVSQLEESTTDR